MTETASNEKILEAKYIATLMALHTALQSYHLISNLLHDDRHVTEHFTTCPEQTCKASVETLKQIEALGK